MFFSVVFSQQGILCKLNFIGLNKANQQFRFFVTLKEWLIEEADAVFVFHEYPSTKAEMNDDSVTHNRTAHIGCHTTNEEDGRP